MAGFCRELEEAAQMRELQRASIKKQLFRILSNDDLSHTHVVFRSWRGHIAGEKKGHPNKALSQHLGATHVMTTAMIQWGESDKVFGFCTPSCGHGRCCFGANNVVHASCPPGGATTPEGVLFQSLAGFGRELKDACCPFGHYRRAGSTDAAASMSNCQEATISDRQQR